MGEWNARSRIRLRSFYLLLRMHRCGQGSVRSEAGPEEKRVSLSLSLRIDYALSLSVFDAFSEHNKQTPPRNLFSYVRGHLPVYASFSIFSLAFLFLFFPLLFGFLHFLTFDSGARVRKPSVRIVTSRSNGKRIFPRVMFGRKQKAERKTFEISSTSIEGLTRCEPPVDESSRRCFSKRRELDRRVESNRTAGEVCRDNARLRSIPRRRPPFKGRARYACVRGGGVHLGLRSKIATLPLVLTSRRPLPRNFVSSLPLFPR